MSQSIIINSINYDGEIANIIFTPAIRLKQGNLKVS